MLRLRFPFLSVALSLSVFGCGATKDTGGPGDLTGDTGTGGDGFTLDGGDDAPEGSTSLDSLDLDPPNATIVIDTTTSPAKAATLTYKAIARNKDGSSTDVAGTATFTIDDTGLGSFAGPTFTSVDALPGGILGTTTTVRANEGSRSGLANLTIIQLRRQPDAPGTGDFYFEVPYKAPATPDKDVLKFGTKIQQVDVAFNMDTTGSMSGSVSNLQTNLSSTLIPNLKKVIPSVGVAIVDHKDYPVCSHGGGGDFPVKVYQVVTTDIAKAQAATVSWSASGGADGPESQVPSMWHMLTGGALNWSGGTVAKHVPKAGTVGGVDFRAGALPVLVLITDVSWHDAARDPYCSSVTSPPVVADVKKAFADTKAKFINITSYDEAQADDLSDTTKSNIPPGAFAAGAKDCPTGVSGAKRPATGPGGNCRLNFLHSGGTGVSDQVVKAIQAISVGSVFDVTAQPANDPTNPSLSDGGPPVDATQFIKALRAMSEGDAKAGCPSASTKDTDGDGIDDTFTGVKVGTPVCFEVIPAMNITVPPKPVAQFYKAFINVLGMPGSIKLDQRFVLFLVPPKEIAK